MLNYEPKISKKAGSPDVQPKLKIGRPGDKYEMEADRVADKVMRMSESDTIQMQPEEEEEELQMKIRMQPMEEEEEEEIQMKCKEYGQEKMVQAKAENNNGNASDAIVQQINSTSGNGAPLPSGTNKFMSSAIGSDFSGVKIHTDAQSVQMNHDLHARAFTSGNNIFFNKGEYKPDSQQGKRLLAHELTHVVQQSGNRAQVVQKQDPPVPASETPAQNKVPFTLASLDNTWHQVINNFVNWAMHGLDQASLPATTPGKAFTRGLANDFAWIAVGLAAGFAGPVGGTAVAMAKSLIDRKKEQIKLWAASKFSAIKAIIRIRLSKFSATWKESKLKWAALQRVLTTLGPNADMNNKADIDRRRQLIKDELTGHPNDTDAAVSQRIRREVEDRWAYFQEAIAAQKRKVREARRKEGFLHFVSRGLNGIGYWDKDDESPGLNLGDAMKMPEDYVPPRRRVPTISAAP